MAEAELFNIENKKADQRKAEMAMTGEERLRLCVDLIDLHLKLSPIPAPQPPDDDIEWIVLSLKKNDKI